MTFARIKKENRGALDDLPHELSITIDHLQSQSGLVYDVVKASIQQEVMRAAEVGRKAQQFSWISGLIALLLGAVVAAVIVHAINDPLRRLTQGARAIAKGHFWHRLSAYGGDEFSELARDFNVMTEKLGEIDQMKKEFVSHVSHDLKAPLASMRQVMHLLIQEIPGGLNHQQKDLLSLSYKSAERLSTMVGNLLDVSRIEAGTMEYDIARHDVLRLIKEVAGEFEIQARYKNIRFLIESGQDSVLVECDRDRIVQVISNLFENALKFSPNNTNIITTVADGDHRVRISVSDSGPGIPDAHKQRIFTKFYQVKNGNKMAGQGIGLGLAICKTIVEGHRGEIWVEDNPNGGSVFGVVLQTAVGEEALKCGQTA